MFISLIRLLRIRLTPPDGGSRRNTPRRLWTGCHLKHTGHTDTYGRMRRDTPAPTLTCRCTSLSNGRFGHPEQHRAISIREAAAIQSFGDDYLFCSNASRNAAHMGNAVPPLMARVLGEAIALHAKIWPGSAPSELHDLKAVPKGTFKGTGKLW